jgi:two-component system, chemotaxis family, chemotaxis protein CheY
MSRDYIVCVDDEQAVLNQLSAQLTRRFGATHVVECADSAEEALALIPELSLEGDVQLVICDQVMPGMKGDRFLAIVNRQWPEVMKVLLTGQAGLASAIYAINNAGLHRYVEKPWEAEDLNLTVEGLLTQYDLRRALRLYHDRLGRQTHELRALHEVARTLSACAEVEDALALAAHAARLVASAPGAAAVALTDAGRPTWDRASAASWSPERRRQVESALAEAHPDLPAAEAFPAGLRDVPLMHGSDLLGLILLEDAPEPCVDTRDFLSLLARQAAATLHGLALVQERLQGERLSTVGRMISTIVHDFRNPMTAVRGYASMFEQAELPRSTQKEYARLVVDEADRMSAMIDEILEFTRGGAARLRISPVSLEALADRIQRLLEPDLTARRVQFRCELAYKGGVAVDAERIQRALLNIASNALDAMESGGTFTLASRLADGAVELTLDDTGVGIPEELRSRIFEPFFTHGKPRGIGLGMSITRRIVEEHGGQVTVSDRPGGGTRFTVVLPLAPRPSES